ncbi:MAG: hypothetical protein IJ180_08355 [Bacteroidales bacterium]|nr:hypothetical protein [Bacteroidales bacterium]
MTKKLYIPTSSLNFNNILSSESISPKSFYIKRNFGTKRFELINENNIENCIILYEEFSNFDIPKSDRENHPLTIEIAVNDNFIEKLNKIKEGIYACTFTININPWNTRFIFFSEKDKTIALSLSDSYIETKPNLYLKRIFVEERPKKNYDVINHSVEINTDEIKKDFRINRLKGFLYGYYIGTLLSTTKENVETLSTYREIYDIFVSILSTNSDRKPNTNQNKKLDSLFNKLSLRSKLYNCISSILSNWWADKLLKIIYPIINRYISHQDLNKTEILKHLSETDNQEENKAIKLIEEKIFDIDNNIIENNSVFLSVSDKEVIIFDENLKEINTQLIQTDMDKKVFIAWINRIFLSGNYEGKINIEKRDFSKDLTYCAKDIYTDSWEKSPIRKSLNDLRKHLVGEEFDFNWNNDLLSSLAAFIIKGEDWEKLLHFCQSKGMYDYRLCFAFYGAFKGFANMERDFTDILYTKDKNYVSEVYKEFHRQLFGEEIVSDKYNKDSTILKIEIQSVKVENNNTFAEKVWNIAKSSKKSPLTKKEMDGITYSLNNCNEDERKFIELLDNQIPKGSKVFKSLQKEFYPNYNNNDKKTKKNVEKNTIVKKENELSLFSSKLLVDDNIDNILNIIKPIIQSENDYKIIEKEISKLWKEYQPTEGYYYKREDSRTNYHFIDHFGNYCFSNSPYHKAIDSKYREIIEKVQKELRKHYE